METRYALTGAAGYIAPRHLTAMRETGGTLEAACDPSDSVGILDSYFPSSAFFTEFESFEARLHALQRLGRGIHHVAVCSPNHLHRAHVMAAFRAGADAICEKPLALFPEELDDLAALEAETGRRVRTILQLRLHPAVRSLRERVAAAPPGTMHDVDLGYFTSRGPWYHASWKADEARSGGIATNIGVHFFDMLGFVFGGVRQSAVHHRGRDSAAGYLELDRARVRWILSINRAHLPARIPAGQSTYRSITVDGEEIEFSGGFTDLHTESYRQILAGGGFGVGDVRPAIETVAGIRTAPVEARRGERHPDLERTRRG